MRFDIQIDTGEFEPGAVEWQAVRDAMTAALEAVSNRLGSRFPWEAVAFDADGDAFESFGYAEGDWP